MRLIDADALAKDINAKREGFNNKAVSAQHYREARKQLFISDGLDEALALTLRSPTVDAVPVVRCKDCKYARRWYSDVCLCDLWDKDGINVFGDGFCNYGKRKEEDNGGMIKQAGGNGYQPKRGEIGRCSECGHNGCASDIWNEGCKGKGFCPY